MVGVEAQSFLANQQSDGGNLARQMTFAIDMSADLSIIRRRRALHDKMEELPNLRISTENLNLIRMRLWNRSLFAAPIISAIK